MIRSVSWKGRSEGAQSRPGSRDKGRLSVNIRGDLVGQFIESVTRGAHASLPAGGGKKLATHARRLVGSSRLATDLRAARAMVASSSSVRGFCSVRLCASMDCSMRGSRNSSQTAELTS